MNKIYLIAEAGVNHNGSMEMAKQLIDVAVSAGVDAVKFQTFRSDQLVTRSASKAEYQVATTGIQESQYEMLKRLELSESQHQILIDYCRQRSIAFLSTPFDLISLDLLVNQFSLEQIKISSGDLTHGPLLLAAAKTGRKIILSTGMSTLAEIEQALGVLAFGYCQAGSGTAPSISQFQQAFCSNEGREKLREKVTLLHCTTEYPAPLSEINLRAMHTMHQAFGLPVGYSDHSKGIAVPIAAAALGAKVIEKHFTLDRNLPGPDHQASLEPDELNQMVKSIREVELALGSPFKIPTPSELKNKKVSSKSLHAKVEIKLGEPFKESNLTVKRPGDGVSPFYYWEYLGKKAEKHLNQDDKVSFGK